MMNVAAPPQAYAFARGEEVVARLAGAQVYHLQGGGRLSAACVPTWTIGRIIGTRGSAGRAAYLLAFRHDENECLCWIREADIDGVC